MPLLAYAFTGIGETLTRSIFGSGAVIAFGKRVFLFLAIRSFARDMLTDPLLKLLGKFVLIPVGALYALGLLDMVAARLEATVVPLGNLSFNLLWLIQFFVVGGVIFGWVVGQTINPRALSTNKKKCAPPPVNWPARQPRLPFSARPF